MNQRKPLIHSLLERPMSGDDIETRSFEIIDREAPEHSFTAEQWQVARRMIHTVGDPGLAKDIRFSPNAVEAGVDALKKGRPMYVDSNMIRSGLSMARLRRVNPDYDPDRLHCHVADEDVAALAKKEGLPRSLFAVKKAAPLLDGGIAVFGNAPVGLMELNRWIVEDGGKPALVVGMPVGFVHVLESKEELMSLGAPFICIEGRRGGSPLAVSVIHALCSLAED